MWRTGAGAPDLQFRQTPLRNRSMCLVLPVQCLTESSKRRAMETTARYGRFGLLYSTSFCHDSQVVL